MVEPVASTSRAVAQDEETPMIPDEDEQQINVSDLFSAQDLVDRLVSTVRHNDPATCCFYIRQLEFRNALDLVNAPHSSTNQTALVVAASKEPTRAARMLVRILARKGAKLPTPNEKAPWLTEVQAWAIAFMEEPVDPESEEEKEVLMLFELDYDAAQEWQMKNLPPPDQSEDGLEDYGGYTSDDIGGGRALSVPLDDAVARYQRSQRALTADLAAATDRPLSPVTVNGKATPRTGKGSARQSASQPPNGVIDLTESRTPSPMPKEEELDAVLPNGAPSGSPNGRKRPRARPPAAEPAREPRAPEARAHLHVGSLPDDFRPDELIALFNGVPGVLDVELHQNNNNNTPFGYVSLASLATAQHAYALKHNTPPRPGATRNLELKIYSADGLPLDPHRQVEPVVNNVYGGAPGAPPPRAFNNYGGPFSGPAQFRAPRPRVPFIFTAAELARRVYLGCLRYGISEGQVAALFHERAGVVAKVLRVMNAQDGSHAFSFVQLPDAITADHAIKVLHGTVSDGHLLQVEHVNELGHRWLWSLSLHGLPLRWDYRDVSDFLISTIGSFAGLIVRHSPAYSADRTAPEIFVRVELRYETELKWAFNEPNGLMVDRQPVRAHIEQARVRREVENELAFQQLAQGVVNGQHQEQPAAAARRNQLSPTPMSSVHGGPNGIAGYDPRNPSGMTGHGGATPLAGRPQPPPPPPPAPAKAVAAVADEDAMNPFSPKWLMSNR